MEQLFADQAASIGQGLEGISAQVPGLLVLGIKAGEVSFVQSWL